MMETTKIVHQKVLEILERNSPIDINTSLMEEGLNSLKAVQLIVSLEDELEIIFDDEFMLIENFETIGKILETVEKIKAS